MAIKTTRWSPDTCSCVVEYSWDDTVAQDNRTHTFSKVVTSCPEHSALSDAEVYAAVTDENPRKNKMIAEIIKQFPSLVETKVDPAGESYTDFKKDMKPNWSFDAQRVLNVTIPVITALQKTSFQTVLDGKFGSGKVKVV